MTELVPTSASELHRTINAENGDHDSGAGGLPPSLQASAELQYLYNYFNERLFNDALPQCMVVYTRKKNCFGYFAPDRFRNLDGELAPELALNPTYLSVFGDLEACKTMAHEQAHVAHYYLGPLNRNGNRPTGGYHCKNWGDIMRRIGLMPSKTGKPGGKQTGYQMLEYVIEGGRFDEVCKDLLSSGFKISWGDNAFVRTTESEPAHTVHPLIIPNDTPVKKDRIKFTCPSCAQNAWAKPSALLACGHCNVLLAPNDTKG